MSLNIEIKSVDRDPAATLARVRALGDASDHGVLHQRDTYFAVASGRLKLREQVHDGTAELMFYERPADEGIRRSSYVRAPVDGEQTRELLDRCLGVVGVVTKHRRLFLWHGVRIHLDEVEGLGAFIELEAVVTGAVDPAEARARVDTLIERLEIARAALEPSGYLDLLLAAA